MLTTTSISNYKMLDIMPLKASKTAAILSNSDKLNEFIVDYMLYFITFYEKFVIQRVGFFVVTPVTFFSVLSKRKNQKMPGTAIFEFFFKIILRFELYSIIGHKLNKLLTIDFIFIN